MQNATPCTVFRLDAGFQTTRFVPTWMDPRDAPTEAPIRLPALPHLQGRVLTADAMGHEAELLRHFQQLPNLPPVARRSEISSSCSLDVAVMLDCPGVGVIMVDMFAASVHGALDLLDTLADPSAQPGNVYDNLDQGWALRIELEPDDVLVLDWDHEVPNPRETANALRLPRAAVAAQAADARRRLAHLHTAMVETLGIDLWFYPAR